MKKMRVLLLLLGCLLLTGCSCKHEWTTADCVNPETCTKCGETAGEALGHNWVEATCTTVRTCSRCGRTEGDPLGHAWVEAACTEPKTCSACGEIVGEALGHTWLEATTDAPATCSVCGATEGEKITADPRFVTESAKPLFGRWETAINYTGEELGVESFEGKLYTIYWLEFDNLGNMKAGFELQNKEEFREAMTRWYAAYYRGKLEEAKLEEDTANEVMEALLGVDIEEFAAYEIEKMTDEELVEELLAYSDMGGGWSGSFEYYVEGDSLYWDTEWKEDMHASDMEFIGSALILEGFLQFTAADPA